MKFGDYGRRIPRIERTLSRRRRLRFRAMLLRIAQAVFALLLLDLYLSFCSLLFFAVAFRHYVHDFFRVAHFVPPVSKLPAARRRSRERRVLVRLIVIVSY